MQLNGIILRRSHSFSQLREKNFIERTRRNWWDDRSQCPKPSQSKTGNTQSLDVNNLAGVFIILLGGVVVSIVLLIIERRCKKLVDLLTNSQVTKNSQIRNSQHVEVSSCIRVSPNRFAIALFLVYTAQLLTCITLQKIFVQKMNNQLFKQDFPWLLEGLTTGSCLSVRTSSYGCTREVWRTREKHSSSFLS